ncbi:MAG: hypothetical protein V1747_02390 [Candidatus Omnitrophota bacterium]
MKKNIIITGLVVLNIITGLCLVRGIWLKNLWENEARNYSKFAAGLWAVSDFHKGKLKKLRLRIEDQPNENINKDVEFEEEFVIKEWVGYTHVFPILRGIDSPNIQVARIVVNAYNWRMKKCYENPDLYKKRLADEIENWNETVIKKRGK